MLFPLLIAGLYWKRCSKAGAVAGGAVSTALTIGWLVGALPADWTLGWIPVVPAVISGALVLVVVSWFTRPLKREVVAYFDELWEPRL